MSYQVSNPSNSWVMLGNLSLSPNQSISVDVISAEIVTAYLSNAITVVPAIPNSLLGTSGSLPPLVSNKLPVLTPQIAGERPLRDAMATQRACNLYNRVPASATNQALKSSGNGALGDSISYLVITVTTAATSAVSLTDGSGTGSALSAYSIVPANTPIGTYSLDMGDITSIDGPWQVTTAAGVSVLAVGLFT